MKITLIAPILSELGVCTIAPQLKAKGHRVKTLFVPGLMESCLRPLRRKTMDKIAEFLADEDLVGVNSFSENSYKTAVLVDHIKKTANAPVIWGGIYATLKPEECLKRADIVCVGEGEEALTELAEKFGSGNDAENIKNLLFRTDSQRKPVQLRPPVDLNSLLPLDYEIETQYIAENYSVRNVEENDFGGMFLSYSSRGCPFRCSYCCNHVILDMYKGFAYYRQRNIDSIIDGLKDIRRRFKSCKKIWFNEADFLAGKTREKIEYFSKRYKSEIGIPFGIWSDPNCVDRNNIKPLKEAGLSWINIGTINASERIQKDVYNRVAPAASYISSAGILEEHKLNIEYDFILCNPYENDEDLLKTIRLVMSLPKPFRTVIYSLTYFPKTKLYEMALRDGLISEEQETQSYTKAAYKAWKFLRKSAYLNAVASMMRGRAVKTIFGFARYGYMPEPVLKILISGPAVKFFNCLPFRYFIFTAIGSLIEAGYNFSRKAARLYNKFRDGFIR